ncbi:MAG: hypothetical protein ACM3II_05680, partial [Rhodospirillaceae bacterium]
MGLAALCAAPFATEAARVSPQLSVGPKAAAAAVANPQYSLFTCQVIGLSPGATCYDPYQMRRAYGIDKLIGAGYNGAGHTIVIVDAFGSPDLGFDLGTFTTFYGLPTTDLTIVAPDGTV